MSPIGFLTLFCSGLLLAAASGAEPLLQTELKNVSVDGQLDGEQARLVIQANLKGLGGVREKSIYGTALQHSIRVTRDKLNHIFKVKVDAIEGGLREIVLALSGEGDVKQVSGEGLEDWSVRQAAGGNRFLVLRLKKPDKPVTSFSGQVTAETGLNELPTTVAALTLRSEEPALANGYVLVRADPEFDVQMVNPSGLVPVEPKFLPVGLRPSASKVVPEPLAFRFHGSAYSLPLKVSTVDPEAQKVVLDNFSLVGQFSEGNAAFTLGAVARVKNPKGASLDLLTGGVALAETASHPDWRLAFAQGRFVVTFDKAGEFPLRLQFTAAIRQTNGWNQIDFGVAPSALQPVAFHGLKPDTQFQFTGAARPARSGDDFVSFLPPTGQVRLAWKESRPEAEGALFYAVEGLWQLALSPGLLRQTALLDFKVMQGELNRVSLLLQGAGEVTRVQGPQVLAWTVEPVASSTDRRLTVQFNQAQKDQFSVQIQMQTPLGAFPQAVEATQLRPEGATRFGGYLRVVNEGAVRLEVLQASGLSQIAPEQFPQTDAAKTLLPAQTTQSFVYRCSGGAFQLRIQADNILPELTVSEVLAYHLAETELAIEAELELDVREAPIRELWLRMPRGYAVARLTASGLSDYYVSDQADQPDTQLRLVYGSPLLGRQVVQLRLERNQPLAEAAWRLPRLEVVRAKSVRGHVGVSADAGFRLTPATTQGLTDIATAFFPKKVPGLQAAFRLSDAGWQATLNVERLPQSIQVDAFHLFSVGEGIAYGSSILNYLIAGAPIATFRVELSGEYFNVEFAGKDVRSWQKTGGGYLVQLHTPVSGACTLLATYERPFKAQGEKLTFTGARPVEAQSEQGHTIVVSTYQFQVQPADVSSGLVPLEPGEVPAEYRLFFDAPVLAAYRYTSRPFNLQLELKPLVQGETVGQVVDRAALTTRISEEGQVVTDARYFVKNKGTPHLRLVVPDGAQLWSVTVNGTAVVPVTDDRANLIPLPQHPDPNAVNDLQVKLAARAKNPRRLMVAAPVVSAPVLLAEWRIEPDTGQRLGFRKGTLTPVGGFADVSGFAGVLRLFGPQTHERIWTSLGMVIGLLAIAVWAWRSATREGTHKFSARHVTGGVLGLIAWAIATVILLQLADGAQSAASTPPRDLRFIAPVQQADNALAVEVTNAPVEPSVGSVVWTLWPALLAVAVGIYARVTSRTWLRNIGGLAAWTLVFWAALRWPNGAPAFFLVSAAFVFLQLVIPSLRRWWLVPPKRAPAPSANGVAATTALVLLCGLFLTPRQTLGQSAAMSGATVGKPPPLAESVIQQIRVEDEYVFATAKIRWQATKGQVLPLLHEPGVLTRIDCPAEMARLVRVAMEGRPSQALVAEQTGAVAVDLEYQTRVTSREGERGFVLPTQHGLVNRLTLTLVGKDVDLAVPEAVAIRREGPAAPTDAVFSLVLAPVNDAWIAWKPRSRDTRREKAVFYAEIFQLYVPGAGVVEGLHQAHLRPAQGELNELTFDVPMGSTITDVVSPALSLWRFDPDARKLRISLSPPQARSFSVLVKSQIATGPVPFEQSVGLLAVNNAAAQIGLLGVATGAEVQLADVQAEAFSSINLDDFPATLLDPLRSQVAGLTLRRAYRYSDPKGAVTLKAAPVEPDVRVETQQTLSLGEDRTVLAVNLEVEITRAGVFRLSFLLPAGLDVESISGATLSHWTELKTDEGRLITLHLKSRTEGKQQFAIGLSGPGVQSARGWSVPRLVVRGADKQRGQLLVVPEQGLRLQVSTRDGVTQLDPAKSGVRQKGVLAFRLLQSEWKLALDLERVDAWVQVTSLQHVTLNEAQLKVAARLQYEIENTGVKAFRLRLPAQAQSVRFRGDQVSDFLPRQGQTNSIQQEWEVKLHRRVIGQYLLQVNYSLPLAEGAAETAITGVEAQEVNLQRGFVTVQSSGRLQVRIDAPPAALQPAEWQSIPRLLQQDIQASAANYTFRLVEPGFRLPVRLERHEAAKLLPARVSSVSLTSVIADDGVMLTQARLQMVPGDKRLLQVGLPDQARFWFAFVGQNSVWPWREQDQILIPLGQHAKGGEPTTVEFFYTSRTGTARPRSLDLTLLGPRFDLPLENITWRVLLSEKWQLKDWTGSLQLEGQDVVAQPVAVDLETYVRNEASLQKERTREAEQLLSRANTLLEQGDPEEARRAFQAAYGLSQHDNAFNEDARVQLHNLKMQQALVGLNVRQAKVAGETSALATTPRGLREGQTTAYTQQEAKQLLDRNTAEDSAAQIRLAERLIQQQDAALTSPAALRAALPQQGRRLTFTRPLQVDRWADLRIRLEATAIRPAAPAMKLTLLVVVFLAVAGLTWASRTRI